MQSGGNTLQNSSERNLTPSQKKYLERYGTKENFIKLFSPSQCSTFAMQPQKCFMGDCPTIVDMQRMYGLNITLIWIENQIRAIFEFSGAKKSTSFAEQRAFTAAVIFSNYYYYKLSELMLFFHKFKSGEYGLFYGSIDPMIITQALIKFKKERCTMIDKYTNEAEMRRRLNGDRSGTISYEDWRNFKKSALMNSILAKISKFYGKKKVELLCQIQNTAKNRIYFAFNKV